MPCAEIHISSCLPPPYLSSYIGHLQAWLHFSRSLDFCMDQHFPKFYVIVNLNTRSSPINKRIYYCFLCPSFFLGVGCSRVTDYEGTFIYISRNCWDIILLTVHLQAWLHFSQSLFFCMDKAFLKFYVIANPNITSSPMNKRIPF